MKATGCFALLATVLAVQTARAEEVDSIDEPTAPKRLVKPKRHTKRLMLELGALAVAGEMYYFRGDGRSSADDWQLPWDMRALESKLTGDGIRFDGNGWVTNAVKHPASGTLTYLLARENGFSLRDSFLVATFASGAWEFVLEWAEYASLNDLLVTSTAAVPLGETVHQIAHNWRAARYEMRGGMGMQDGEAFKTLSARAELDLVPQVGSGRSRAGDRVAIALEVPFDNDTRSQELGAKTSLGGYYSDGLFAGVSTEFDYRHKRARADSPWDLLATVSVGPTVDKTIHRGGLRLDLGADLYADFAMVKSAAFDAWKAEHPMETVRNVMRTNGHPYYYAAGASIMPRVNASFGGASVGGKLIARRFSSFDGADRDQEMLTVETHQIDRDITAEAWLGYELRGASIALDARIRHRSGEMNEASGGDTDKTMSLTLGYRL